MGYVNVYEKIKEMYNDFEEMIFSMSQADGIVTVEGLERKSTYDFYRYNQLLRKKIPKVNG